jgi:hypothetical protein
LVVGAVDDFAGQLEIVGELFEIVERLHSILDLCVAGEGWG